MASIESLCWFFTSVGVNPRPPAPAPPPNMSMSMSSVSADMKRSLSRFSRSSREKFGVARYRVESARVPIGCGIDGKTCVLVGNGGREREGGVSEKSK